MIHRKNIYCLAFLLLGLVGSRVSADIAHSVIPLYPQGIDSSSDASERVDVSDGLRVIRNVTYPELEVFQPSPDTANGTAVIVAPGGGFMMLSYDSEGTMVAKRLAEQGVTAFVLKYRLSETPDNPLMFKLAMMKLLASVKLAGDTEQGTAVNAGGEELAAMDAARAVEIIKRDASKWNVHPERIGFIGFSAGAITAANVSIGQKITRPAFVGMIYGAKRGPVPTDAPPAFVAGSVDDPLLADQQIPLFNAWRTAGVPVELHLYETGGHGYGLVPQGSSSDQWFEAYLNWLDARGLLKPMS